MLNQYGLVFFIISTFDCYPQYPTSTTTTLPPRPFKYAFSAARIPGGKPDRYIQSEGDANGIIRGNYAYLDPNFEWQKVEYVADENGFHVDSSALPVANPVAHPQDTYAVARAKANHDVLYEQIALRNSQVPLAPVGVITPAETPVVASHREAFHTEFERIAAEHARIAAEHQLLAELEEKEKKLAKGQQSGHF